ncbi:MAG: hypothetical protein ABI298_02005 [Acidimicrobiales bacterium]
MKRRPYFVTVVALTLGCALLAAGSAGASTFQVAGVNPYCQAMVATHPSPPTNNNPALYHRWAMENLTYFERLESEATMAKGKSSLRVLVPILKFEARSTNMKTLGAYLKSKEITWVVQWQDFDVTVVACAKWAVNLL